MAGYSRDPLVRRDPGLDYVARFTNGIASLTPVDRRGQLGALTLREWKRLDFLAWRIGKGEVKP